MYKINNRVTEFVMFNLKKLSDELILVDGLL